MEQQKREERGGYPNGLNERCPILRTYAISPRICKSSDTFRFAVEYQYDEENPKADNQLDQALSTVQGEISESTQNR